MKEKKRVRRVSGRDEPERGEVNHQFVEAEGEEEGEGSAGRW